VANQRGYPKKEKEKKVKRYKKNGKREKLQQTKMLNRMQTEKPKLVTNE
jgi:hypothetical protein